MSVSVRTLLTFTRWLIIAALATAIILLVTQSLWKPLYHSTRANLHLRRADRFLKEKQPASALIEIQNGYRFAPSNSAPWLLYANYLDATKEPGAAASLLQAFQLDPKNEALALKALTALVNERQIQAGLHLAEGLRRQYPQNPDLWQQGANLLILAERPNDARYALLRCLDLKPINQSASFSLAALDLASVDEARKSQAEATLKNLRRSPFFAPLVDELFAESAARKTPPDFSLYQQYVTDYPQRLLPRLKLITLLQGQGDTNTLDKLSLLLADFSAQQDRKEILEASLRLLKTEQLATLWEQVPTDQQSAIELAPFHFELLLRQGNLESLDRIINEHLASTTLKPNEKVFLILWSSRTQALLKDPANSAKTARVALDELKEKPYGSARAGDLFAAWNMTEAAIPFYEQARLHPLCPPASRLNIASRLIDLYQQYNRTAPLLALCRELRREQPQNPIHAANLASSLLYFTDEKEYALELANKALTQKNDEPGFSLILARALIANQRGAEALALFEKLPSSLQTQSVTQLHYASALIQSGKNEEAQATLKALNPDSFNPVMRQIYAQLLEKN